MKVAGGTFLVAVGNLRPPPLNGNPEFHYSIVENKDNTKFSVMLI